MHSHQVALRRPNAFGEPRPRSEPTLDDEPRSEPRTEPPLDDDVLTWLASADLHVDPWDGGGGLGSCTLYSCLPLSDSCPPLTERMRHLLLHRGLAVFPRRDGGRGVHIGTIRPGWHCALLTSTCDCRHGSVVLDPADLTGFSLPDLSVFRVVAYPLRRIESLLARAGAMPHLWDEIRTHSDESVRKRIDRCRRR